MSSQSSRLLDLAPELRLQIYDAVVALRLDCQVARRKPSQQLASDAGGAPKSDRLPIPWLDLMLVCKLIASELQHYVQTSGNFCDSTTYEIELDNLKRPGIAEKKRHRGIADELTWRRIPCPPGQVRTLHAELTLSLMTKLWGSGGPMPILSQLYQVLNSFIHRGPFLARESPLGRHIHLDALILQLRVAEPDPEEPSEYMRYDGAWPVEEVEKDLHRSLEAYISRVVDRGLLFGAVDQIVFRFAGETTKWEVSRQKIGDMREWNAYHFDWGVPGSSSLEASGEFLQPKPEPSQSNAPTEDF